MIKINHFYCLMIKIYKIRAKKNSLQRVIFAETIVTVIVLNFSVRDGKRCVHYAIITN